MGLAALFFLPAAAVFLLALDFVWGLLQVFFLSAAAILFPALGFVWDLLRVFSCLMLLFVFLGVGFSPHFCSHCCHGWCFFGLGLSVFRIWFGDFALMVWWFFGHGALVFLCAYIIRCGVV